MTNPACYEPILDQEKDHTCSDTGDGEDERLFDTWRRREWRISSRERWRLVLELALLTASFIMMALALFYEQPLVEQQKKCGRLLGQWLPDAEYDIEYEVRRFHSPFQVHLSLDHPDPAVDELWANITSPGDFIGITKEEWEAVNEYDSPVLLDEDYGTGRYMAKLEVFHQLHCLDLLRKSLHRDRYDDPFVTTPAQLVEGHLQHCVEMLRQTIMCKGDMSLLTYNWVAAEPVPYPNSNTLHTCKKWETLAEWNINRATDGGRREPRKQPEKPNDNYGMSFPP